MKYKIYRYGKDYKAFKNAERLKTLKNDLAAGNILFNITNFKSFADESITNYALANHVCNVYSKDIHTIFLAPDISEFLRGIDTTEDLPYYDFLDFTSPRTDRGLQQGFTTGSFKVAHCCTDIGPFDVMFMKHEADRETLAFNVIYKDWLIPFGVNGGKITINVKKEEAVNVANFVLNLLAHMQVFPDCVKDEVPKDIKYGSPSKKNINLSLPKHLKVSPKSAHMRRGHFRHLTADRYKNKKNKMVFVRACVVNSKAKTVFHADNNEFKKN